MTPKNRTELVELMARAIVRVRVENNSRWAKEPFNEEQIQRAIDCAVASDLRGHTEWFPFANAALTALEQAGCVVVPREATEEMLENVNSDVCDIDEAERAYDEMLSASPFKEG